MSGKIKWPSVVTLMRHAESSYNALRKKKQEDRDYLAFKEAYKKDYQSPKTVKLAKTISKKFSLGVSDYDTPLTQKGNNQACKTGIELSGLLKVPDVILFSPYLRTRQTLEGLIKGWSELKKVKMIPDERIREQEHGLSLLYNDWRVFHVLHPEQKRLRDLLGPYWYRYPQGESVCDVRDRCREKIAMLIREYSGQKVLLITHHLTKLSFRANLERLSPEEFIRLDENEKPKNCGITNYVCNPRAGKNGRLKLIDYNRVLY